MSRTSRRQLLQLILALGAGLWTVNILTPVNSHSEFKTIAGAESQFSQQVGGGNNTSVLVGQRSQPIEFGASKLVHSRKQRVPEVH